MDLDGYHCYEGFFHQSLVSYLSLLKANPPYRVRTPVNILSDVQIPDAIHPTAFIFHAGRCGSTLLAKVLARSRANLVLSEVAAHNEVWRSLPNKDGTFNEIY